LLLNKRPLPAFSKARLLISKSPYNTPVHLLKTRLFESPVSNSPHRLDLREIYK